MPARDSGSSADFHRGPDHSAVMKLREVGWATDLMVAERENPWGHGRGRDVIAGKSSVHVIVDHRVGSAVRRGYIVSRWLEGC